jgi:hypothetical protein
MIRRTLDVPGHAKLERHAFYLGIRLEKAGIWGVQGLPTVLG